MNKLIACLFTFLFILTQAFGQTSWTKYSDENPVFPRGSNGAWDDQLLTGPYVLFDGTSYHLWYGGYDGGSDGARIGYAHSSDGIIWARQNPNIPVLESGSSGSWDDVTVYQPCVLFDGVTYHMWYGGHDGTTRQIGYATSPDSINWTKHPGNPVLKPGTSESWDDEYVDSPNVLLINDVYHMWYSGFDGISTQSGHATSSDGIIWEKDALNPVLEVGAGGSWDASFAYQPSVVFDGTTYHLWYSGGEAFAWQIGYAYSSDGREWTKHEENPVLEKGSSGSWDDTWVGLCGVTFNNDSTRFKMWYAGGEGIVLGDIGYAISDTIVSSIDIEPGELPQRFSLSQNFPNPFNPTTIINYELPITNYVELSIYSLLGQKVTTLVSERQNAGSHQVEWNASGYAGGVYYYHFKAGEFQEVKKMILLR